MLAVLFGLVSSALGFWGMWIWRAELILVAKGLLPVSMIFAGVVAIIAGLSRSKPNA